MNALKTLFQNVEDPRSENITFDFVTLLFIALSALICGAESCADIADFYVSKRKLFAPILKMPLHRCPSHDTFSRMFRTIDPEKFESCFALFTQAFAAKIMGVVAIDGKSIKGAYEAGKKATPFHVVNVWAAEARLSIAQTGAPGRSEIKGVLNALATLALDGCRVTADALHCRDTVAQAILKTGADYILAVKGNQPKLLERVQTALDSSVPADVAETDVEHGHGRIEKRSARLVPVTTIDFPNAGAVAEVVSHRTDVDGTTTRTTRYFILSCVLSAAQLLQDVRSHWGIENQLHWSLDVVLKEDASRARMDNAPRNLAILRKIALNILRQSNDKASLRRRVKKAGWDDHFLLSLLSHMR